LFQEFSDNRLDSIFSARAVERSALLQTIDKIIATDQRLAGTFTPRADAFKLVSSGAGPEAQNRKRQVALLYALDDGFSSIIVPASLRISVYLLAFLTGFGVVVPLDRLTAVSEAERTFFVVLLGLGLLALLTFIYWQRHELRLFGAFAPIGARSPDLE
jgi:hypothetical protein